MFNKLRKAISKALNPDNASWNSLVSGGGNSTASRISSATLMASNKNWVYACVDKLADTIAGVPFVIRKYNKQGDDEIVYDHPVFLLLDKPNAFMTRHDFLYIIVAHLELTGSAYILKDQPKNPKQLLPLPPQNVTVVYDEAGLFPIGYKITTKAGVQAKTLEDIIHLKYPNPEAPLTGRGTLASIAEWVDVDNAATAWNRMFFENGSSPSLFFETEATTPEQLQLAKLGYDMRFTGINNAHKAAFLPKGTKKSSEGANPRDMEFSEADNRFRDKILSGFGVPKSVLGISEIGTSRADAEAKNYVFLAFTIEPKVKRLIEYLNEYFLTSFTGVESYYFSYEPFVPDNEELKLKERQVALAGQSYKSINDVRSDVGLAPITNGDAVYGSFAAVPIGSPVQQPAKEIQNGEVTNKQLPSRIKHFKKNDDSIEKIARALVEKMPALTADQIAEIAHKEFINRTTPYEKQFIAAVEKHDKIIMDQVLATLADEYKKSKEVSAKAVFNVAEAENLFVGLTIPVLQKLIKSEGDAQQERLNTTDPFNPNNATIQNRVRQMLEMTAQSYTNTTLTLLNNSLSEGVSSGESLVQLEARVADIFNLTSKYRAEQTARTTVFATANASAREAYRQSGVVTEVKWHTAEDEMVCQYCGPMNGKTIGIDAEFFKDGQTVTGRDGGVFKVGFGDVIDPPLHVNCRCYTDAVVSEKRQSQIDEKQVHDGTDEFVAELLNEIQHETSNQ